MFHGLTQKEQKALIFFSIIVLIGLSVSYVKSIHNRKKITIEATQIPAQKTDVNQTSTQEKTNINKNNGAGLEPAPTNNIDSKININTSTQDELMELKGIGEKRAEAIIKYRQTQGSFQTIEEIKNISGIGDKIFENIKEDITVGSVVKTNKTPTKNKDNLSTRAEIKKEIKTNAPININKANQEELMTLYGIGIKISEEIIKYRNQNGEFKSIEEIIKVKGIGPKKFEKIKNQITVK